ncbi:MAG: ABC transporter permease [Balneolaceae bacterium]|nr:ABC transporter permease [Balneolaceae bacterium]MBO6544772.1 ABC transporter permease [Balneolaceae bacterium]MBO6646168.1 ABC transporter permease [Balneolaceae bacterium]
MVKNYIKIAFRNLFKNKTYSGINIFGLAVGICCCVLIGLYVQNEWSYDEFHSKSDRIYRIWYEETMSDQRVLTNTATPVKLGPTIRENIPEAEHITYVYNFNNLVTTEDKPDVQSENFQVVNKDFFQIFDFELLTGDASSVFNNPSSVVLSESAAQRLLGDQNPLMKVLSIRLGDTYYPFTVTGVIEDVPSNSSLSYNILMPIENLEVLISERGRESWFSIYGGTFITLNEGTNPENLDSKFASMMERELGTETFEETNYTIHLQPLEDIHLNTELDGNLISVSDPVYSYILSAIAILILIIACINFMTLSISRSTSRAKEVGIRKTIGAYRQHLMFQFWGEALLMTGIAFLIGLTFAELLLPYFNNLSGTDLNLIYSPDMVLILTATATLVSLFAGIYPALILSGFKPIEVLKGRIKLTSGKGRFQEVMVVFQFALSITLIIGTITIQQQMNYVQKKNLGFQKDQVLVINSGLTNTAQNEPDEVFQQALRNKELFESKLNIGQGIEAITVSSYTPVQTGGWFQMGFSDNDDQIRNIHGNVVDAEFITSLGINIKQGRNFSDENTSDSRQAIIVNEATVEYFGWENPIGERLPGPEFSDHEVIGVVENFHFESLHTSVKPLVLAMSFDLLFSGIQNLGINNSFNPRMSMTLTTSDIQETVSIIQDEFKTIMPGTPFTYSFVDQALDNQYRQEQRLSQIVSTGSLLAIIIACLGLFGLASLMVTRRTKEIGVRKVLGASSSRILFMINAQFTLLVIVGFVIAAPVAWFGMNNWLKGFAYQMGISIWTFIIAGSASLLIAWLSVGYQSFKATTINPVESLKGE